MATFREDIIEAVGEGTLILGVVIGMMGWASEPKDDYNSDIIPGYESIPFGKIISWVEAEKFFDYEYSDDYGSAACPPIYIWTNDRVFFVTQYDGSTAVCSVPRNPTEISPLMFGGG